MKYRVLARLIPMLGTSWLLLFTLFAPCGFPGTFEPRVIDKTEPVFTENASIKLHPVFNLYLDNYHGVTLQEANQMDGNTFFANITIPFSDKTQLRIEMPYYTEGDAVLTEAGDAPGEVVGAPTHIKGFNGLFNFYSLLLEHRLSPKKGFNALAFYGLGYRIDRLDTTFGDQYNDLGFNLAGGVRLDRTFANETQLLINYKLTFYAISDDIGPSDRGIDWFSSADAWFLSNLSASVMLPKISFFRFVLSGRFLSDFLDYHPLLLGPEIVFSWRNIDLKAGVLIGVNDAAEDTRVRVALVAKTF